MIPVRQDFRENLGLAFDTIRTHKLRSFLAVLGVLIGVALIILVVGLVQGFRTSIAEDIASVGLDTAWVARFIQDSPGLNGRRPKEERERKPLTFEEPLDEAYELLDREYAEMDRQCEAQQRL